MNVVRTRRTLCIAVAAGLLGLTVVAASSCSSKSGGTFSSGDDGPGGGGQDGSSSGASGGGGGSSGGFGTSSGLNLSSGGGGSGGMGTGTCKDGTYAGLYQCSFNYNPGADGGAGCDGGFDDAGFVISGNISFQLAQDLSSGESFTDKASGGFGGTCCAGLFSLEAGVSGQLKCGSGVFTGTLSNGSYTGFFMTGSFSGPLDSQYNGTTYSFVDGTWNLTVPGQGTCCGIWSANLQDQ
ncbi:MAG: hypothetical protein ACRENE_27070 [Polyangiaceae bacterium]